MTCKHLTLLFLLVSSVCFADISGGVSNPSMYIEETDGSPSNVYWKLIFPNNCITDNGDNTASLNTVTEAHVTSNYLTLDQSTPQTITGLADGYLKLTSGVIGTDAGGGSMVYPGAGIAVSTGSAWGTSLTDNHSNWDTAYGWGQGLKLDQSTPQTVTGGAPNFAGGLNVGSTSQFGVDASGNVLTTGTLSAGATTLSSATGIGGTSYKTSGTETFWLGTSNSTFKLTQSTNDRLVVGTTGALTYYSYSNEELKVDASAYAGLDLDSDTGVSGIKFSTVGSQVFWFGNSSGALYLSQNFVDRMTIDTSANIIFCLGDNAGSTSFSIVDSDVSDIFSVDSDGNVIAGGTLAVNGGDITSTGDIKLDPTGGDVNVDGNLKTYYGVNASGFIPWTSDDIWAITFSGNTMWAVKSGGLYKSTDFGKTFTLKDANPGTGITQSAVLVASNGYIYWTPWGYGKIRRSTDGGDTWGDVGSFTASGSGIWALTEDNLGYIYAGIYTNVGTNQQKILYSTDNGATWTTSYNGSGWHIHDVAADPYQPGYIYATADPGTVEGETWKILRSDDNGATWDTILEDSSYIKINFLSGMRLFGADDANGTIIKTTDDTNFTTLYQSGTSIVSFCTAKIGDIVYFGQIISGGGKAQIVSTDGTTAHVEWQGNSSTNLDGPYGLASNGDTLYVGMITEDPSFKLKTSASTIAREIESDGDILITPRTKGVLLDGGLTIGSTKLAGDNNFRVEGTMLTNTGTSAGGTPHYYMDTTGEVRWAWGLKGAETGANAGSNLSLFGYSDTETFLYEPITITRSNADVKINQGNLYVGGSDLNSKVYFRNDTSQWVGSIGNGAELNYYGRGYIQLAYNTSVWGNAGVNEISLNNTTHVAMPQYGAGTATFGAGGVITSASDERLKDVQGPFTGGLKEILALDPITYKWKPKGDWKDETIYAGFSAQNVQKSIPEAIGQNSEGYLSLADRPIIAALVNAVKELKAENDNLKAHLDKLEQGE